MVAKIETHESLAKLGKFPMEEIDKVDGFTPRVKELKQRLLEVQSTVASDRAWYMLESYKQTEGEHPAVRRAKAFYNVLDKMPIAIRGGELLVSNPTPHIRGAHPAVETLPDNLEVLLKMHKPSTASASTEAILTPEDKERLLAACEYWKDPIRNPARRTLEIQATFEDGWIDKCAASRMRMPGALVLTTFVPGADYDRIMAEGFNGFIKEAKEHIQKIEIQAKGMPTSEDTDKVGTLRGFIIAMEAMINFAKRHADLAREMAVAESDPQRKKELEEIADVCEWVPANPPRNFREGLQAYWFVAVGHDIEKAVPNAYVGRFDQYMWPLYEKDINEGVITRQEAAELLGCMFVKWATLEPFLFWGLMGDRAHQELAQANYIANVTLGGITRNNRDAVDYRLKLTRFTA